MSPLSGFSGFGGGATSLTFAGGGVPFLNGGDRGIVGNLYQIADIEYFDITTTGNASSFGDSSDNAKYGHGSLSNITRGVFAGGNLGGGNKSNVIDYITIGTTGNATDFGDLLVSTGYPAGLCDGTRGVFGVHRDYNNNDTGMEYITVANTGNSTDFGDVSQDRWGGAGCADSTRGVFSGGYSNVSPHYHNIMDYITVASTGNATDFGDLSQGRYYLSSTADATRGVICGGAHTYNTADDSVETIEYITIQSASNSTDFGDLLWQSQNCGTCSNGTRGVHVQSYTSQNTGSLVHDEMCYFTIQTAGNATDFGDTVNNSAYCSATSGE